MEARSKNYGIDDVAKLEDEIVADITENFLTDEKAFTEFAQKQPTVAQKLLKALKIFIVRVQKHFANVSNEFKGLLGVSDLKKAEEMWTRALVNAMEIKGNVVDDGGEVKYDVKKNFSTQVDETLNGKLPKTDTVYVGNTPQILLDCGLKQLPILITQKHIRDIVTPESKGNPQFHGIDVEILKNILQLIENPAMIFDSITQDDSIVVIVDEVDSSNRPILVAIKVDGNGYYNNVIIDSNFMTSVYGKDNFLKLVERVDNEGKFRYIGKKRSQNLFKRVGLQLPQRLNKYGFNIIITPSDQNVKPFLKNNSNNSKDLQNRDDNELKTIKRHNST